MCRIPIARAAARERMQLTSTRGSRTLSICFAGDQRATRYAGRERRMQLARWCEGVSCITAAAHAERIACILEQCRAGAVLMRDGIVRNVFSHLCKM